MRHHSLKNYIALLVLTFILFTLCSCIAIPIDSSISTNQSTNETTTESTMENTSSSTSEDTSEESNDSINDNSITFSNMDELIEAIDQDDNELFEKVVNIPLLHINDSRYELIKIRCLQDPYGVELTYTYEDRFIIISSTEEYLFAEPGDQQISQITIFGQNVPLYQHVNKDFMIGLSHMGTTHIAFVFSTDEDVKTLGPLIDRSTLSEMIKWYSRTWVDELPVPFEGVTILLYEANGAIYKLTEDTKLANNVQKALENTISAATLVEDPEQTDTEPQFKVLFANGTMITLYDTRLDICNVLVSTEEQFTYSLNIFNAKVLNENIQWYFESCYSDAILYKTNDITE